MGREYNTAGTKASANGPPDILRVQDCGMGHPIIPPDDDAHDTGTRPEMLLLLLRIFGRMGGIQREFPAYPCRSRQKVGGRQRLPCGADEDSG